MLSTATDTLLRIDRDIRGLPADIHVEIPAARLAAMCGVGATMPFLAVACFVDVTRTAVRAEQDGVDDDSG